MDSSRLLGHDGSDPSLQPQSLLFRKLPVELRLHVLEYILSEASNGIIASDMNFSWTRLQPKPDLRILLTCRRAYYEGSLVMESCVNYYILCGVLEFGFKPEKRELSIVQYHHGQPAEPADSQFKKLLASVKDAACIRRVVLNGPGVGAAQFRMICDIDQFQPKHLTIIRSLDFSIIQTFNQHPTPNVLDTEPVFEGWTPNWSPIPNSIHTIVFCSFVYCLVRSKDQVLQFDPREAARAAHVELRLTNYAGDVLTPKGADGITFSDYFHKQKETGGPNPLWRICRMKVRFTR